MLAFAATAAGGDGRGRRLWRRGAAIGALRHRPAAGRGRARHHPAARLVFFLFPPVSFWRSSLLYAMWFALARHGRGPRLLARHARRRALQAPGAGARRRPARGADRGARRGASGAGFTVVGFVGMNDGASAVAASVNRADLASLPDHLLRLGAERGRARARGAAQRAAAQRSAPDQDHRRPRPRFLLLPRARDRPGRSRQPQSVLADLLRRLLRRAAPVELRASGCSTSRSASRSWC